jgi:hypothetical protein
MGLAQQASLRSARCRSVGITARDARRGTRAGLAPDPITVPRATVARCRITPEAAMSLRLLRLERRGHSSHARQRCCLCLQAEARATGGSAASALLRVVHFGSQRPVKEVRRDCCPRRRASRIDRCACRSSAALATRRPGGVGSCHGKRLSRAATSLLAAWSAQGPGLNGCWSCPHLVPAGGSLMRIR